MRLIDCRFMEFFQKCKNAGMELKFNRQGLSFLTGYTDDDIFECFDRLQVEGKINFTMNSLDYTVELLH